MYEKKIIKNILVDLYALKLTLPYELCKLYKLCNLYDLCELYKLRRLQEYFMNHLIHQI